MGKHFLTLEKIKMKSPVSKVQKSSLSERGTAIASIGCGREILEWQFVNQKLRYLIHGMIPVPSFSS
jgi:hypothetical protein